MMAWDVRSATAADLETIVDFNQQMALDTEGKALERSILEPGVRRALTEPGLARYFVVEDDEGGAPTVVGQLMLTEEWSDWRNGRFLWIQSVYVAPSHRRRGVYQALHRQVEELAKQQGDVCGIRLYVEVDNEVAKRTYERLGMSACAYRMYEQLLER